MANKTEWSPGPKCGPDKSGQLSLVWSILAILFDLQCKQQCDKVVAFSLPSPLLVSKFYFPPIRWQRGLTRGLLTSARDVLALGSSAALSWLDRVERAPRESRVWPPLLSNVECRRGTKLFRRTECWEKEAEKEKEAPRVVLSTKTETFVVRRGNIKSVIKGQVQAFQGLIALKLAWKRRKEGKKEGRVWRERHQVWPLKKSHWWQNNTKQSHSFGMWKTTSNQFSQKISMERGVWIQAVTSC